MKFETAVATATLAVLAFSSLSTFDHQVLAQETKKEKQLSILYVNDEDQHPSNEKIKVTKKGLSEVSRQSVDPYDVLLIHKKDAAKLKDVVRSALLKRRYVMLYDETGTLSSKEIRSTFDLKSGYSEVKDSPFQTVAVGLYAKQDGTMYTHSIRTKHPENIAEFTDEVVSAMLLDIGQDSPSTFNAPLLNGFVSTLATPTAWSDSDTTYDAPQGRVTVTRNYTPTRVNSNTKTIWTTKYDVVTTPGDLLYRSGIAGYGAGWFTKDLTFRAANCSSCNAQKVESFGPNSTDSNTTASVSLGTGGINAQWTWALPYVTITNLSVLPSYARWYITFNSSNSQKDAYNSQPGAQFSSTSGVFIAEFSAEVNWLTTFFNGTTYTGIWQDYIPDF